MLSLNQKLALQQKLSPQQIQYQKLLQLNTLALEQRIKAEIEINPILEEIDEYELLQEELKESPSDTEESLSEEEKYDESIDEFDVEDYMNDVEIDETKLNKNPNDEETVRPIAPQKRTLSELLMDQLHMLDLPESHMILGEIIIGNLDENGYFKSDMNQIIEDLKLFEHIEISVEDAESVLKKIQTLDPVGIAARDLRECLLIQLKNYKFDEYYSFLAIQVLENSYEAFINKRFDILAKEMDLSMETLKEVLELIQKLDPKPGEGTLLSEEANQITPDFIIEKEGENFIVTLNDKSLPSVTISSTYLEMLNQNKRKRKVSQRDRETRKFLREKFESAKWFIASIRQRRETLMKIMRSILEQQFPFFEFGPRALKPMIYKDVADEVELDISTISRVVNGKYVQSPMGIHELKYFFSEGLATDSGSEVSNKHIKELIKEIVDNEPKTKPFSDDKIAKILTDKGIHIARRTIAKYREQMMVPVARLRKEL